MKKRRHLPSPVPKVSLVQAAVVQKTAYALGYTTDAGADIKGLDGSVRGHVRAALEKKIAIEPESYGTSLRSPLTGYWKYESGGLRIIYRIYKDKNLVVVCAVGARKAGDKLDIYAQLEQTKNLQTMAEQVNAVLKALAPKK
jgi:mRNA interferase RelE/StbE